MEFHYEVTIKGTKSTIEFKKNTINSNDPITGVEFMFNSSNASRERDREGRIEIILHGKFNSGKENLTAIKELSDWAKSKKEVYREVKIVLRTVGEDNENGNYERTYHFDRMFCLDYCERTGTAIKEKKNTGLEFELLMAQGPDYTKDDTFAKIVGDE